MRSLLSRITLALILGLATITAGSESVSVNNSGTWRTLTEIHVNDAGTWREIQEVYVNDSGTWRLVFSASTPTISNATFTDTAATPANAGTEYFLENDGDITVAETDDTGGVAVDQGDWLVPKTGMSGFDVRCTLNSGSLQTGACNGTTWMNLGTTRSWRVSRVTDTPGLNDATIFLEIRKTSTGTILDSATITIEAAVTA